MNKHIYLSGLFVAGMLLNVSCIDDKYDLDDIDTTSAIKVNNLVVPVNLDKITLDEVLDLDENDLIKKYTDANGNQYYAIEKDGEFSADSFELEPLESTNGATIKPISINNIPVMAGTLEAALPTKEIEYNYHLSNVDPAVDRVTRLTMTPDKPMEIDIKFTCEELSSFEVENLVISIPESFSAYYNGSYYEKGGEIAVGNLVNGELVTPITVQALNLDVERESDNTMTFEGMLAIVEGKVKISSQDISVVNLTAQFSMSGFTAETISGKINYEIESPDLQSVDLNDIPDFLSDSGTNLILENPQIYLYVSNPTTANIQGTLNLNPMRDGVERNISSSIDFLNYIALAPNIDNLSINPFETNNYVKKPFPDLSYVLSGEGIPSEIGLSLDDARVVGDLINFNLTKSYALEGSYTFFTPLALGEGSRIIYKDKETDFFGDDVKEIQISHFQITTYPQTNLPFAVTLSVSPLDKNGNVIMKNGKPITASGTVAQNADGTKALDLNFTEEFTGLDGVEFTVTVDDMNGKSLTPDQYVILNKIRARVTGEYVTDF